MNYIFKYMHMLIFNFKLMLFYITHISVVTLQQHIWKNRKIEYISGHRFFLSIHFGDLFLPSRPCRHLSA